MSRYSNTKQIKDQNGKRRAETTILSAPPATETDIFIRITSPERLDLLADKFYGDSTKWWIIAQANGLGKGTFFTPEDQILRIPDASEIKTFVNTINKER